jgi:predicted phage terminase large subunit-like protein
MRPTIRLRALHPAQARIRAEARRFNVVACGRRFGKTDFGLDEAIDGPMGLLDGYPVGWFAPHSRFFEETWIAASNLLEPITFKRQEQKKRITLDNGAVFEFWGLEDPNAGRSRKYGKVIVDEAATVVKLEQAWEQAIAPTLMDLGGNAYFLSSPKGFNFFKVLHDRGNAKVPARRPEWMSWTFPSQANPHVPRAEIEKIAAELPQLARDQEIRGRFVDLSGASVHRDWVQRGELPDVPRTIAIGVDLAISLADSAAYTAIVTIARTGDGRVYVLEVKRMRKPFHAILQEIVRAAERWKPAVVGIESNQFQAAVVQELLRTTNLPVRGVTAQKDKLVRFQPMLARYEQGLVYHTGGLPPEFEEELFAFPLGDFKDMCDALGLAYTCCPDPGAGGNVVGAGGARFDWGGLPIPDEHDLEGVGMVFPNTTTDFFRDFG